MSLHIVDQNNHLCQNNHINLYEMKDMVASTEFKTHLGEYFTQAMHEPVFVTRRNHEAVLISKTEYDRLQALEDAYWLQQAQHAEQAGYIGTENSMEKLKHALS